MFWFTPDSLDVSPLLVSVVVPWLLLLLYASHYHFFRRPRPVSAAAMAPLVRFLDLLTSGATAGFDAPLIRLFHPDLLGPHAERGVVRAVARAVCARFGRVRCIPPETVLVRGAGADRSLVALVDFASAARVRCRLRWAAHQTAGGDGFRVTGFRLEPPDGSPPLDVLAFARAEDFVPFAERFVWKLLRSPAEAVEMMAPALRERSDAAALAEHVAAVCAVSRFADVTLTHQRVLRAEEKGEKEEKGGKGEKEMSAVRGMEMRFEVRSGQREWEAVVVLTFAEWRCFVARYELRRQTDTRTQILLDHDTGEHVFIP